MEARIRVIEEQRELDHGHFVHMAMQINTMAEYIRNAEDNHASHAQSVDQRFSEVFNTGLKYRQDNMAIINGAIQQQGIVLEDRLNTWAIKVDQLRLDLEDSNHRETIIQAHLTDRTAERPVEGKMIKDRFAEVQL